MDILPQLVLNSIIAGAIYAMVALGIQPGLRSDQVFQSYPRRNRGYWRLRFFVFRQNARSEFIFKRFYRRRYGGDCRLRAGQTDISAA